MTDYYVRKTGSDANDGTNPTTQAWLTIDKAANTVATGDTVYVGAGVYRELVTIDANGTSGSPITWIADVDGENTGDAGLVIISAYANETAGSIRTVCIDLNSGKKWNTFRGFVMTGGTDAAFGDPTTSTNSAYDGIEVEDCVMMGGHQYFDDSVQVDFNEATAPTGQGMRFRRCVFQGSVLFRYEENQTADVDLDVVFESCLVLPVIRKNNVSESGLYWDGTSSDTFSSGGVSITNCTFMGLEFGVYREDSTATHPIAVRNSTFLRCGTALNKATTNDGALTSDYNTIIACETNYVNVTAGSNDDTTSDPGLFGGLHDIPLYRFWGWSPYRPWEPIRLQDDSYIHNVIGRANTAVAPAFDLYNDPRPMHGTVDDIGAVEGRARAERETTTVRTGSNAIVFEGAGFHDILLPVDASSTTVEVYGRFDATYAGTKPQLKILNIPGVVDQTDIMTGASGAWEQLSINFTPTSQGIARIRLVSNDTSAGGESFFDDLAIT